MISMVFRTRRSPSSSRRGRRVRALEKTPTDAFSCGDDKSHRPTKTPASATAAAQIRSSDGIFYVTYTKGAAWSRNSKPPANRQFSSAI